MRYVVAAVRVACIVSAATSVVLALTDNKRLSEVRTCVQGAGGNKCVLPLPLVENAGAANKPLTKEQRSRATPHGTRIYLTKISSRVALERVPRGMPAGTSIRLDAPRRVFADARRVSTGTRRPTRFPSTPWRSLGCVLRECVRELTRFYCFALASFK